MLAANRFCFLNEEHELASAADWNNADWPRLWTYNLHYFDDLDSVGAPARAAWHAAVIDRWISENPAPLGAGWEPYCLSLRIVNWCRFAWSGGNLTPQATQCLAVQLRALKDQIEVHLLGNHLFANAKALVFGGLYFEGAEADRWLEIGSRYLQRELAEQILADGGHFERSPMYHNIIAGDVLDLLAADRMAPGRLDGPLVDSLRQSAPAMISWAELMAHDDGEPAFFNDSAMAVAPPRAALQRHAVELDVALLAVRGERLRRLAQSGYVRAQNGPAFLLADVGDVGPDYLPGHAHADTLSFELSLNGRRLLVNSGTSVYAIGTRRSWERSTAAHNTIVVDGEDSSEVWSSFRVARRARAHDVVAEVEGDHLIIEGAHDGYRRLPGDVTHRRRWVLTGSEMVVEDTLSGRPRNAEAFWHFHPEVSLEAIDPALWSILRGGAVIAQVHFEGGEARVEDRAWAPEFGRLIPNQRLRVTLSGNRLLSSWRWTADRPSLQGPGL